MNDNGKAPVVLRPGRDIVASTVEMLRQEWKTALAPGASALIVDLSGVEMIDSMGLGLLIALHNTLDKSGCKLRVASASPDIQGLLRTMRLDKHFILDA